MDPIGTALSLLSGFVSFFHDLVPGGWGLLLLPAIVFGLLTLWAARRS
jgi:hypothetical protein